MRDFFEKNTSLFFKNADFWLEKSEIPSNSVDLIITDPPIFYTENKQRRNCKQQIGI